MGEMNDKVVLVTGVGSEAGIGFATARAMLREGARVVISDLDGNAAQHCAARLGNAHGLGQDVTDEAGWSATIDAVIAQHGRIDALVNNAGIVVLRSMDAMTLMEWEKQINVCLTSVYLGCHAAMRQFRAQGNGGAIVNISSTSGLAGVPGIAAYCAAKGGSRLFTKAVALEGARENIRANSVHPGMIWTDMQKASLAGLPDQSDIIKNAIPMGRMGTPDDVAEMVVFLASDRAGYVTGAEFVVDGGFTAQ